MTLGLATFDTNRIYLAIESKGLPARGPLLTNPFMISKIVELQSTPEMVLLTSGGLEHWVYTIAKYSTQNSLKNAANELAKRLDECMAPRNQAFGLLCGFEHGIAEFYQINRFVNQRNTQLVPVVDPSERSDVMVLGDPGHASLAHQNAVDALKKQKDKLSCLVGTIENRFPAKELSRPVHVRTMKR